ncbi:serine hydrolase domain-containing protein [Kitasatospora viridis]|uniref:CubicO group peptidase (Beta-lactamase class C family) n=1 Tax=Kitasatospora viridis TaxID=281105 RepID=A0A561UAP7_9ACTN|nr:serine hydrolase domain-containing protein [Kitasatospora viridis]TWF96436.1 CubicO group peptidase (beta-lactamase class C family) [Kitasatospora viridis]
MGFDRERLTGLHDVLAGHVAHGGVPGLVALVAQGDQVHVEALGKRSLGGGPVGRDTLFRVASMTKPVTAVAALILAEECRLRLDGPVDELLPELAGRRVLADPLGPLDDTVPAHRSITLRDLLTFRMGTGLVMAPPGSYPIQRAMEVLDLGQHAPHPALPPEPEEWLRRFATLPLMHQPGERWLYNTAFDVLGVLIARASGRPFEEFLRERVFEPLGMRDTGFHVPADQLDRFTTCYAGDPGNGGPAVYDEVNGEWAAPPAFPAGSAGLVSTVDDFLAFGRMLLAGGRYGGRRLLSPGTVELLATDQLTEQQKTLGQLVPGYFDGRGWGMGVAVVTRTAELGHPAGQYGWDGGLGSSWAVDPVRGTVGVLLTSRAWSSPAPPPVCQDFWTAMYAALTD